MWAGYGALAVMVMWMMLVLRRKLAMYKLLKSAYSRVQMLSMYPGGFQDPMTH